MVKFLLQSTKNTTLLIAKKFYAGNNNRWLLVVPVFMLLLFNEATAQTSPQTFSSTSTWLCPANVFTVQVQCWGGGGAGGGSGSTSGYAGGGGSGGGYCMNTSISVTPGTTYNVTVGTGGTCTAGSNTGGSGNPTSFSLSVTPFTTYISAVGGTGGTSAAPGVGGTAPTSGNTGGTTNYYGGNGGTAKAYNTGTGAGGSSAGTGSNGNAGTNGTSGGGGAAVTGGGAGAGGVANNTAGATGSAPGGGGSGSATGPANATARAGGSGGAGKVILTWTAIAGCTPPTSEPTSFTSSSVAGTSATVGWTRPGSGGGDQVLVIISQGSAVNAIPSNTTTYSASSNYNYGSPSGTAVSTGQYAAYIGTGSSVNLTNLLPNATYYFAVYEFFNSGPCYYQSGTTPLTGSFSTTDANMFYVSSTTTRPSTATITVGQTGQVILGVQVVTAGTLSALTMNSIQFNTTGCTNVADLTNAKVYYTGTSSTFATTTQFGSTYSSPSGTFSVTPGTGTTLSAGTNYFWLTYDIPLGATAGDVVDAQGTQVTLSSGSQTPAVTNPAGSRTLAALVYCTPASFGGGSSGAAGKIYIATAKISGTTFYSGGTAGANPYTNLTSTVATVTAGQTYTLELISSAATVSYGTTFGAWVDWNDNGTLNDAGETILTPVNVPKNNSLDVTSASFTVPSGAVGNYRLRVQVCGGGTSAGNPTTVDPCDAGNYDNSGDKCSSYYGEDKDFTINVLSACTPPTTGASNFASSNLVPNGATSTATISFTRGNGTGGVIVVAKDGSAPVSTPATGTVYTGSSTAFGSGTTLATGEYLVYASTTPGDGASTVNVNLSALTSGHSYYFTVYEFGSSATACYILTPLSGGFCIGAPSAVSVAPSSTGVCSGSSTTLSLSGLSAGTFYTYNWQYSNTSGSGYANAAGTINTSTYATPTTLPSSPAYYICNVTCPNTSSTTASSPATVTTNPFYGDCYCAGYFDYTAGGIGIAAVNLNGNSTNLNYTASTVPNGNIYTNWGYQGGTNPDLAIGNSYTVSVTVGSYASNNAVDVWIDWDHDGVYETSNSSGVNEFLGTTEVTGKGASTTGTYTFTVPASALSGLTGMRVRTAIGTTGMNTNTNVCNNYNSGSIAGETEDFAVNILGCTGPSTPASSFAVVGGSTTPTSASVTFTRGNGSGGFLVVVMNGSSPTPPTSGTAYSNPQSNIGAGGSTTGAGSYVVYNSNAVSTGSTVTVPVSGLTPGHTYYFAGYEWNTGANCFTYTSTPTGTVSTPLCTPPGVQAVAGSPTVGASTSGTQVLNWGNNGNSDGVIVVLKQGSAPTDPSLTTSYTANAAFGTGSTTAAGSYVVYEGSATTVTVTGLATNLAYYYKIYTYTAATNCYNLTSPVSGNFTTANAAMGYVSSTTTQTNTSILPASTNQQMIGLQIVGDNGTSPALTVSSITFNTTGSTSVADISNAKIYYTGTSSTFSATGLFGSQTSPSGTVTVTGSQMLSSGTNYFWITYDIASSANLGDVVKAACTSFNIGSSKTPSVTTSASRTIQYNYCSYTAGTNNNGYACDIGYTAIGDVGIDVGGASSPNTTNLYNGSGNCPSTPYTNLSTTSSYTVNAGSQYILTTTLINTTYFGYGYPGYLTAYLDVANDGALSDAGDQIWPVTATYSSSGSYTFTVPANISAGSHRLRVIVYQLGASTTSCSTQQDGTAFDFTLNVTPSNYTWVGPANGDWNTAANWSPASVPNSCAAAVTINSGTPVIGTTGSDISVGNITIGGGATLTLNGKNLNVCGTWTGGTSTNAAVVGTGTTYLNSTTGAQVINGNTQFDILQINNAAGVSLASRANVSISTGLQLNTGQLDVSIGTLILLSTSANSNSYIDDFTSGFTPGTIKGGNVVAQRYVPVGGRDQHFISSPLGSVGLSQIGATGTDGAFVTPTPTCDETISASTSLYGSVFTYVDGHEPSGGCMLGNWRITTAGNMLPALGYSTYLNGNSTLSVTGSANTGDMSVSTYNSGYPSVPTLQQTENGGNGSIESGWALVGNPYPSSIDLTATRTGYDNQVQIWQTSGPFSGTWQAVTITGEHGAVVIPPFQAFMVHVSTGQQQNNYTYNFHQSERTRTTNLSFYRNQSENSLTLNLNYNGMQDMTTVTFNPSATNNFDAQYDADKQDGSAGRPTLYTYFNDQNTWYAINTVPSLTQTAAIPVGLRPENNGTMTINAQGIESFDPTTYIYLEDKQTGTWTDLRNGAYTFTTTTNDNQQRFVLHFTPPAQILTQDASCEAGGMINITQPGTANWSYTLTDANNNTTIFASGTLNTNTPVNINAEPGLYTLTLTDNNGYTVVKAIQVGGTEMVSAAFTAANTAQVQQNITFASNAAGASVYNWNFGDGNTANGQTTSHSYNQQGIYNVVLNVNSPAGCTSSTTHSVTVTQRNATGVSNISEGNIEIWSNENRVYIDFSKLSSVNADITMYNVLGQMIDHETYGRSSLYSRAIDNVETAYIIVKVLNNNVVTTKKVFIAESK